jgi:hypothetical protein
VSIWRINLPKRMRTSRSRLACLVSSRINTAILPVRPLILRRAGYSLYTNTTVLENISTGVNALFHATKAYNNTTWEPV